MCKPEFVFFSLNKAFIFKANEQYFNLPVTHAFLIKANSDYLLIYAEIVRYVSFFSLSLSFFFAANTVNFFHAY